MNRKTRSNPYELRKINRENAKEDIYLQKGDRWEAKYEGSNETEKKGEIGVVRITETQRKGLGKTKSASAGDVCAITSSTSL